MKQAISRLFKKLPKRLFAAVAVTTAIVLPIHTTAANQVKLEGSLGVANVTAGDTKYARSVNASYDQVVKLQVYYHNQELPDSGKVANNLRVKIAMPNQPGKSQKVNASISADNANTVNDQVSINLDRSDAYLEYIPGSAVWKHNSGTNENVNFVEQKISDEVVYGGQGLVVENAKPCFNFEATVTVLARVRVPGIKVDKTVRVKGEKEWKTSNTAKPGDTLEYMISYQNAGNSEHKNVIIGDNLPPKTSLVPGTTYLANKTNPSGVKYSSDNVTNGGIVIGNYSPGANAFVKFDVKLPKESELQCGVTEFRNVGVARPEGMNEFYNTAITKVEKKCVDKPTYTCDLLEVKQLGGRKVSATVKYSATNGAKFKNVTYDFGDRSTPLVTDKTTVEHEYAKDGTYTIAAKVRFAVNGKEETVTNESCAKTVKFESGKPITPPTPITPTTPNELPNTGPGDIAGIFASVTIAGAMAHRMVSARKES